MGDRQPHHRALAEPDAAGKPRDPVALARRIGMTTPKIRTLEIAFHRLAPDTLVFGLNDRIYYLHRAAAPPKP
jgi:hypothetical protein